MTELRMTQSEYVARIRAAWVGRAAGSTLGAPFAGRREIVGASHYSGAPAHAVASPGLDAQMLWLSVVGRDGAPVTSEALADVWSEHLHYAWDEYGAARDNLRRGLAAPVSGHFDNWFRDGSAAIGRTTLWALMSPGAPGRSATSAYADASIDHSGEGVWAAMFWAALQSAAFALSDSATLVLAALAVVPPGCRVARAVRAAQACMARGGALMEAREAVLDTVGHANYSDAPQNVGFGVIGLLSAAGDFGRGLSAAVSCGHETEVNGAAVGATLGLLLGHDAIRPEWTEPIGASVPQGWGLQGIRAPETWDLLAAETARVGAGWIEAGLSPYSLCDAAPDGGDAPVPVDASVPEPAGGAQHPPSPPASIESSVGTSETTEPPEPATPDSPGPETADAADAALPTPDASDAATEQPGVAPADVSGDAVASAPAPSVAVGSGSEVVLGELRSWAERITALHEKAPTYAAYTLGGLEVSVEYGAGGPAIVPAVATSLLVEVRNTGREPFAGTVRLSAPQNWQIAVPGAQGTLFRIETGRSARLGFVVKAPDDGVAPLNRLELVVAPDGSEERVFRFPLIGAACWWVVGPLKNTFGQGFEHGFEVESKPGLDNAYLGRGDGLVRWQRLGAKELVLPLEDVFAGFAGTAYAVATLYVSEPTDCRLVLHTNDGVRLWLNDRLVYQRHAHEEFRPALGSGPGADVTLRAGENRLMLKVVRCGVPLELALAVVDSAGRRLFDLGNTRW